MSQIKIDIDEGAVDSDLVAALRPRGVTPVTALDAGSQARTLAVGPTGRALRAAG